MYIKFLFETLEKCLINIKMNPNFSNGAIKVGYFILFLTNYY